MALLAGVFVLHWPSSDSLLQLWSDTSKTTYTHGFAIAVLVLWLVLRKRDQFIGKLCRPSMPAALFVLLAGLVWIVTVRSGIELAHQLLLLAILWLSVWAVFGRLIALQLWFPIGYLIFAIPLWDQANSLLQGATVVAVQFLLKLSSIPAYVEGNFVHLAAGVFEVAGGCSGIHFFIVSLAISTLYGEIGRDSAKVRVQLAAIAAALALLTNWLRVYIIVVAGYLTNMQHYLVRVEHYNFGWVVFAVMMTVFFVIARRFVPPAEKTTQAAGFAAASVPSWSRVVLGMLMALIAIMAAPSWQILTPVQPAALPSIDALLPQASGSWSLISDESSAWNPVFVGADYTSRREYTSRDGLRVQAFVASYALQYQGKELVGYGNAFIGPGEGTVVASTREYADHPITELIVQGPQERSVIRYYYQVGTHRTDRGIVAQLRYGLVAIRGGASSSVIALRSVCRLDCDEARAILTGFAAPVPITSTPRVNK
ncbi:MAG TPA: EpsI family protein [Povalibacter sp.]|uniref:exosortase A n=1 Tax=Povalibacter sp. TaxID=1962978 RepID=UPI002B94B015|nr:exosortase A [Povalibacter sp.]HMN42956.1 EpsI family protein [Povalibacter sp.]